MLEEKYEDQVCIRIELNVVRMKMELRIGMRTKYTKLFLSIQQLSHFEETIGIVELHCVVFVVE